MKKITINIVLAALCLNFPANSQTARPEKGLRIGDKVPDVTFSYLQNENSKTGKLSDYKEKLLILDFWATWCSPCIAMIPKMEKLQKDFGTKIQFLPVAYQPASVILPHLKKRVKTPDHIDLPEVTDDKVLADLFPHTYLPHYVWIGTDGTVKAITGYEEVTAENINKLLAASDVKLLVKNDEQLLEYDKSKPLFINNNGGSGVAMTYHSLISNYTPGLPAGGTVTRDSIAGTKFSFRNLPLITLFRMAYWDKDYFADNRTVIEVKDTSKLNSGLSGAPYLEWMSAGNVYTYELSLPPALSGKESDFMREDLARYFTQYQTGIEKRKIKCLALVRTSSKDKLKTAGGAQVADFSTEGFTLRNTSIWALIQRLNQIYLRSSKLSLVDATAYTGTIDLSVNANLTSVSAINLALQKYDLRIEERVMDVDMLVIRDRPEKNNLQTY